MSETSIAGAESTLPIAPETETPTNENVSEALTSSAPVTEPEAASGEHTPATEPASEEPVDPKIHPEIDPEPEASPVTEPEPGPEEKPANTPEPLPSEEAAISAPSSPTATSVAPSVTPEPEVDAEPEESFADIFLEFQRTSSRREPGGSQIRGTIVSITADSVLVDIGYKSEGILLLTAFAANREQPKVGDALQVSVKGRDEDGYYQLSLFRTAIPKDWTGLERAFEQKATIVGTVTAVVKGGLHVDVGVKAFLPASRSGARDAAEMEKLIGEEIRVRITKLDVADEDVVVDRRVVTEEEASESKARRYAEVEEGAVLDGTVRSIMDYGAFVDLGGVDGLLHISDIAWSRVANVGDVLTVGQPIEVKVLKIDPETKRIALGLKQLQAHPWDAVAEKYKAGDRIRGVVTRTAEFGAFVELEPGVEGLIHLSEMSWSKRVFRATEVVDVGDVIDALILNISLPDKRISLGLKQALGDPWASASTQFAAGTIVEGPVASITKFGAFVQIAEGVQGLVHISEIVPDRRLNHPSDVLRVGEMVKALVLDIDTDKRQLRLSIKQLTPTSLDEFLSEHKAGDSVTGRIISVAPGVAQVELGEGIVCPCKLPAAAPEVVAAAAEPGQVKVDLSALSSMLKTKWKTGADAGSAKAKASGQEAAKAGQVRNFRITKIDSGAKTIGIELIS